MNRSELLKFLKIFKDLVKAYEALEAYEQQHKDAVLKNLMYELWEAISYMENLLDE